MCLKDLFAICDGVVRRSLASELMKLLLYSSVRDALKKYINEKLANACLIFGHQGLRSCLAEVPQTWENCLGTM